MNTPENHRLADGRTRHHLKALLNEHLDRVDECRPDDPAVQGHLAAAMHLNAAIERFDNGSYGICRRCAHQISPERLEAVPAASLCTDCKDTPRASLL